MWVPDPNKYSKLPEWEANPRFKYSKMTTGKRITIAGELINNSKVLEKCTPGPAAYDNHLRKLDVLPRIRAVCKVNEERKTWIDSAVSESARFIGQSPAKYSAVNLVS